MREIFGVAVVAIFGCSSTTSTPVGPDTGSPYYPDPEWPDTTPVDMGPPDTAGSATGAITLPFKPSNLSTADLKYDGDITMNVDRYCERWRINTDAGVMECWWNGRWENFAKSFTVISQPGTVNGKSPPKLGVFVVRNFVLPADVYVPVAGANALVIVAQNKIVIEGKLALNGIKAASAAGGYPWIKPTNGPGAGGPGEIARDTGGGGGGHCTSGGKGGDGWASPGGAAGFMYGNTLLSPLVGGSSGGMGGDGYDGGGGGGAVQLVAGTSIVVAKGGYIHAGGGGGYRGSSWGGAGGGSGGAILLEAPTVTIAGAIAANGGGGGSASVSSLGGDYKDSTPDGVPANPGSMGGVGGASDTVAGDGKSTMLSSESPGGGGGSSGRVRIRSTSGKAMIESGGIVSPSTASGCTTEARL